VSRGASWLRQLRTVAARQARVMVSDHGYIGFLLALPVILGLLPYVVPGDAGLTAVPRNQPDDAREPTFVLALLIIGGTFMGIAMSIRDLVGERPIFLREKAVGLYPSAYLVAKLVVFGFFSLLSAAIMTAVSVLVKTPPDHQLFDVLPPLVELYLPIALTTWVGAALGLLISALATSNEQVMPVLILVLMVQLVLHGGFIPVLDRDVLNAVSKAVPARWGYAAGASGIDLEALLAPGRPAGSPPMDKDPLWAHTARQWCTDMGVLALFGVGFAVLTELRLRFGRR
jgi:hypothetical protein